MNRLLVGLSLVLLLAPATTLAARGDVFNRVRDGYTDSDGVRIH